MLRKIGSYFAGPIIWLVGYGVMVLIAIGLLGLSPDNYISIGFMAYLSAAVAAYLALEAMSRIYPEISGVGSYLVVAIFALVWVGSSVVSAKYFGRDDEFIYRLISLILSQIGILSAWRIWLGFFKGKEKKIGQAAANIASLLNTYFWSIRRDNNGELPKKFQTDKYILGYITGMTYGGAYVAGINKPSDKEWLMVNVVTLFFSDYCEEIIIECGRLANTKDQLFKQGVYNGTEESAVIYKAMMSGDEEAVKNTVDALKSLKTHLNENYQSATR